MKRYNMKAIMSKAWNIFRQAMKKAAITFAEALRKAWKWAKALPMNNARVEASAKLNGIEAEYHTWYGWKTLGRMVTHGEKAAFQVVLATPEKGEGKTFLQSYFTINQTEIATEC